MEKVRKPHWAIFWEKNVRDEAGWKVGYGAEWICEWWQVGWVWARPSTLTLKYRYQTGNLQSFGNQNRVLIA